MDGNVGRNDEYLLHPTQIFAARASAVHKYDVEFDLKFSDIKMVDGELELSWLAEPGFMDQLQSSADLKTWEDVGLPWFDYEYFDCVHREPISSGTKHFRLKRTSAGTINPSSLPGI